MRFFKKGIDIFEKPSLGNYWFAVKAIRIDAYDFGSASIAGNTIETIITQRNTEMHKGAPGSKCGL
ncbi:MAG: hypothetical protein CVU09_10310 [Bacteroidetes bacterium HGW-Bacteroidetes-4]|nr:MAG: hypothetical protein CVU09_10310 [Bacteroidetes bacterium HGW-Bacteroidetes-4]